MVNLLQSTDREMEPQRAQLTPKGPTANYSTDSSQWDSENLPHH